MISGSIGAMCRSTKPELTDAEWAVIQPLIPEPRLRLDLRLGRDFSGLASPLRPEGSLRGLAVDQLGDLDPTAPTFDDHLTVRGRPVLLAGIGGPPALGPRR